MRSEAEEFFGENVVEVTYECFGASVICPTKRIYHDWTQISKLCELALASSTYF